MTRNVRGSSALALTFRLLALVPFVAACSSEPEGSGAGGATSGTSASAGGGSSNGSGGATATTSGDPATTAGSGGFGGSTSASSSSASSSSASSSSASSSSTGSGMGVACSSALPQYTGNNGSVTFYTLDMGSQAVNCSYDIISHNPDTVAHVATGNGHYFAAINTADYNTAATCGACVEVTRDNNKKVVATVVDQCPVGSNPKCKSGHIDLSKEAFLQLGTVAEGYLGTGNGGATGSISWKYVACPIAANVSFRLKEPGNANWNQILVEGHRYPIKKVEVHVNNQWVSAVRQSYNYWQAGNGNMGAAPYSVRVTDINDDVVQAQVNLVVGDQASQDQFAVCQ